MPGTKKLDRKYAEHLARILRPIIVERFDDNQTAFAKHVGVSQSQMSAICKEGGGDRSVGISVLIRLRGYLNMSLDDMLGLPKLTVTPETVDEAVERALERRFPVGEVPGPRLLPPAPAAKRKRAE